MSNNKQTSVDWLFEKLWETPKDKLTWHSILEQAKEMEKEQIIEDWIAGREYRCKYGEPETAEDYYNKTYKTNI